MHPSGLGRFSFCASLLWLRTMCRFKTLLQGLCTRDWVCTVQRNMCLERQVFAKTGASANTTWNVVTVPRHYCSTSEMCIYPQPLARKKHNYKIQGDNTRHIDCWRVIAAMSKYSKAYIIHKDATRHTSRQLLACLCRWATLCLCS